MYTASLQCRVTVVERVSLFSFFECTDIFPGYTNANFSFILLPRQLSLFSPLTSVSHLVKTRLKEGFRRTDGVR